MLGIFLGVLPVTLLLLGFPVFLVLLTAAAATMTWIMNIPLVAIHQNMFGGLDAHALLAIPFFIYAGELMGRGSVAQRLVNLANSSVGHLPGGIGVSTVATGTVFGAISGSSAAEVATVGRIMLPALRKAGYPDSFSGGLLTAVGAIDSIIPPSIPMIVYGAAAQVSVPRLYAAGILPGLLIAFVIAAYVVWFSRRHGIGGTQAFDWRTLARDTKRAAWALGAPVVILGGIYGGVFSSTEAAAVACVYAGLVTRFIYSELTLADVYHAAVATVRLTAQILIIVACASVFAWLLTTNQIPAALVGAVKSADISTGMLLIAINLLLLVAGHAVDPVSAILLLTPLLVPLVNAVGIDGVHFGVVVVFNLAIGLFTPPFGINIFVAQSVLGLSTQSIYRGIIPFVGLYLVVLLLITYIPEISLFSMRLFMGS